MACYKGGSILEQLEVCKEPGYSQYATHTAVLAGGCRPTFSGLFKSSNRRPSRDCAAAWFHWSSNALFTLESACAMNSLR